MIAFVRWIANLGVCWYDGGAGEAAAAGSAKTAGEAAVTDVAATTGVAGGTAASGGGALGAQSAYAAGTEAAFGTGAAGGGGSLLTQAGTAVGTAATGQAVNALLSPRPPKAPGVTETMPDPLAQQRARQQAMAEQLARRGRASTVLTASTDTTQKLGG